MATLLKELEGVYREARRHAEWEPTLETMRAQVLVALGAAADPSRAFTGGVGAFSVASESATPAQIPDLIQILRRWDEHRDALVGHGNSRRDVAAFCLLGQAVIRHGSEAEHAVLAEIVTASFPWTDLREARSMIQLAGSLARVETLDDRWKAALNEVRSRAMAATKGKGATR